MSAGDSESANHLTNLDQWEDFVVGRYKEGKSESDFRQYDAKATPRVAEFYRTNHEKQTVDYVLSKEKQYFGLKRGKKSVWEAAEYLNTLVDDSDPDTDLTQIEHLLQTSEAIRKDGHPRWMVLVGFIHAAIKEGLATRSRASTIVPVSVDLISKLPPRCRSRSRIPLIPTPAAPSESRTCRFSSGMPLPLSSTARVTSLLE